ncbi:YtxH domain-containing protein [Microbacteriaceae bacterium 4G12]|jgi:oxygen-dependent protoporphyrinogen oxidase
MRGKLVFATGAAIGYVLGARAGRRSYEKIAARASALWNDEKVQKTVSDAQSFVKEKAPVVQQKVTETAKGAVGKVTGKGSSSGSSSSTDGTTYEIPTTTEGGSGA